MDNFEKSTVKLVAKLAGWLGPLPNAFFVARSSLTHLHVPLVMAVLIGAILELLGLAAIHTALGLYSWNIQPNCNKDKGAWQKAPFGLAAALCAVYLVAVLFLSVVLETCPQLAHWAPALFPLVAAVGATTLAIISQQEARVARYQGPKEVSTNRSTTAQERRTARAQRVHVEAAQPGQWAAQQSAQNGVLDAVNRTRQERKVLLMDALLDAYRDDPNLGATAAARKLGVHRNTVYAYTAELEATGRLHHNGDGITVIR
jgi:hypothetical protein